MQKTLLLWLVHIMFIPGFALENQRLLEALLDVGNPSQAYLIFQRSDDASAEADLYRGAIFLAMGRTDEGLKWLELAARSLRLNDRPRLLKSLGRALKNAEIPAPALERFLNLASAAEQIPKPLQAVWLRNLANQDKPVLDFSRLRSLDSEESVRAYFEVLERLPNQQGLDILLQPDFLQGRQAISAAVEELSHRKELDRAHQLLKRLAPNRYETEQLREILARSTGDKQAVLNSLKAQIGLRPNQFEPVRRLAVLYYSLEQAAKGDEVLFEALKSQSNSLVVAREAARVLADHGRLETLKGFILQYRSRVGSPLVLSDSLLYLLATQKDWARFYKELSMRMNLSDGYAVGSRIPDYVDPPFFAEALRGYEPFVNAYQRARARLAVSAAKGHSAEIQGLVELNLSLRSDLASEALGRGMADSVLQLLSETAAELSSSSLVVRSKAHVQQENWLAGYLDWLELRSRGAVAKDLRGVGIQIMHRLQGLSRTIVREARTSFPALFAAPDSNQKHQTLVLEELIYAGQIAQANHLLERLSGLAEDDRRYFRTLILLSQGEVLRAYELLSQQLTYHMDSDRFVNLQPYKLVLLPFARGLEMQDDEEISKARDVVQCLLMARGGRFEKLRPLIQSLKEDGVSTELLDLEMLEGYLQMEETFIRALRAGSDEGRWKAFAGFRDQALKWFENFHQSFYTPRVVERLLQWHAVFGTKQEEQEFIRFCLARQPSSLSAQILRNRML